MAASPLFSPPVASQWDLGPSPADVMQGGSLAAFAEAQDDVDDSGSEEDGDDDDDDDDDNDEDDGDEGGRRAGRGRHGKKRARDGPRLVGKGEHLANKDYWEDLKELGWTHANGSGLESYYFLKPGVKKSTGMCRRYMPCV